MGIVDLGVVNTNPAVDVIILLMEFSQLQQLGGNSFFRNCRFRGGFGSFRGSLGRGFRDRRQDKTCREDLMESGLAL